MSKSSTRNQTILKNGGKKLLGVQPIIGSLVFQLSYTLSSYKLQADSLSQAKVTFGFRDNHSKGKNINTYLHDYSYLKRQVIFIFRMDRFECIPISNR
jgi:hypothetical protein